MELLSLEVYEKQFSGPLSDLLQHKKYYEALQLLEGIAVENPVSPEVRKDILLVISRIYGMIHSEMLMEQRSRAQRMNVTREEASEVMLELQKLQQMEDKNGQAQ